MSAQGPHVRCSFFKLAAVWRLHFLQRVSKDPRKVAEILVPPSGAGLAPSSGMARTVEELVAYQFAITFKEEVYRLIRESPPARRDFEYRSQIEDALSSIDGNIAEGFGRRRATDFANFLVYALGSIAEARTRLQDGILRGHFAPADCATAFAWADRCSQITRSLRESQLRLIERDRAARAKPRRPTRPVRPRRPPLRPGNPPRSPRARISRSPRTSSSRRTSIGPRAGLDLEPPRTPSERRTSSEVGRANLDLEPCRTSRNSGPRAVPDLEQCRTSRLA